MKSGYVALISIVMVMAAVLSVGVAITLLGGNTLVTTFLNDQGKRAYAVADSCAYEAILRIKRQGSAYVGSHSLTVDDDSCTIEVTQTGKTVDAIITAQHDTVYRVIEVNVLPEPALIYVWQEAD